MDMIAGLLRLGADVRTPSSDPGVHVSGHAYRDEQARMIDLTRPEAFVPVHGTLLHLHRHAALAREKGVEEVLVLENGEIGDVAERTEKSKETAFVGKIPTWDGEPIPPQVLADRETIARSGIAFVTVLVDAKGRLVCPPAIATRGVLDEKEGAWDLRDIGKEIQRALSERPRTVDEDVAEVVRAITRRKLEQAAGKKPITVASVLRARP
jgi:ribonuclease J